MTYLLHAAGWLNQGRDSPERCRRHLRDVQLLLRGAGAYYLGTPEFVVRRFFEEGRLLVLERLDGAIDGCIGYDLAEVTTFDEALGEVVQRRICFLRLLAMREVARRGDLARALALEAMLRGTVRSHRDSEDLPQVAGTVGVVMEANERGLRWAAGFGEDVQLARPDAIRPFDPTVAALVERTEEMRAGARDGQPYRLVLARRTALDEAAELHLLGARGVRLGGGGPHVIYDPADQHSRAIDVAAQSISDRNPVALRRLGMMGRRWATAWGGPYSAGMGISLGRLAEGRM